MVSPLFVSTLAVLKRLTEVCHLRAVASRFQSLDVIDTSAATISHTTALILAVGAHASRFASDVTKENLHFPTSQNTPTGLNIY
jgi:hypothetical protein